MDVQGIFLFFGACLVLCTFSLMIELTVARCETQWRGLIQISSANLSKVFRAFAKTKEIEPETPEPQEGKYESAFAYSSAHEERIKV